MDLMHCFFWRVVFVKRMVFGWIVWTMTSLVQIFVHILYFLYHGMAFYN